ncbi:MAG: 1,4-alpha-glucan branching protein GlgB [Anaerolineae bacterium]|jgi:1,4-alpha-glucan branching enzyme|nr:1,4-alpha-glucan branching protein GlgB [Anaerolineae bacterium]
MAPTITADQLNRIVHAYHHDPFEVLGAHALTHGGRDLVAIRAFLPMAEKAWVVRESSAEPIPFERAPKTDFFEALFPGETEVFKYEIRTLDKDGVTRQVKDPYTFLPVLGDLDLQLFNEGNHYRTYEKLGAQIMTHQGVTGVCFAVWAPNAARVSVIGDFNGWDGRRHPMRQRGSSGIWELFIPDLGEGALYKYEIKTKGDAVLQKTDPHGFWAEFRPKTGSVVWDIDKHTWGDQAWIAKRDAAKPLREPMSIYEVHLGSWMRVPGANGYLTYPDLAARLAAFVKQQGYTHIELLPITEHPLDASWGYQVTGYFAPTSRFGTPDEFAAFVDTMHQNGIGVLMDWVPAHFPKNDYGLIEFDGTALYEYADTRLGEHLEWGTKIFNWGRNEVRQFLVNSALFWLDKYHIDGLRVDAVASMLYRDYARTDWIPNEYGGRENLEAIAFLKQMNERIGIEHPGAVTCAEESTSFPAVSRPVYLGGLGFTFKWNMGWMHDTLDYIAKDPIYRKYHHNKMTFGLMYAFSENFILPISHDEVVHLKRAMADKMPGDFWQRFANLRLYYGFMWTHPGKKLLFMGQDFGQWTEWNENRSLDWHLTDFEPHQKLLKWVADLNRVYRSEPSLYEQDYDWQGFEWIDANDWENSALAYVRRATNMSDHLVVVCNFTPVVRRDYRVGVPEKTTYKELLNSDSEYYFGSNVGNAGALAAEDVRWQTQPYSVTMTLPPLSVVVLKPERKNGAAALE